MGTALVAELARAIDDLLATEPADVDDVELHEAVIGLQRQSHRLAALRARLVAVWDTRRSWADDGSRSPGHRLAREASMSVKAAKSELRRARALTSMPSTAGALAEGGLSPEHVDLLAGANSGNRRSLFESNEATLVEQCQLLRFTDAYRMVEYWKQRADATTTDDDAVRLHDQRGATAATTLDGMVDLRALLDPVGGAAVTAELDRILHHLRSQDQRHGDVRTVTQWRADALVEMAHRSRAASEGGLRPRPLLTVLVGDESLARVCELANGTVIAPGQVVPLLADADVESIIFDGPRRVLSVSSKRTFTGALRRAIEVRDRHCQHPSGCDEPAERCDVDHIQPWTHGGATSQDNGRLGCHFHNRIERFRHHPPLDPGQQHDGRAPPDAA